MRAAAARQRSATNRHVVDGKHRQRSSSALWGPEDPIGRRFQQISPAPSVQRDLIVTGVYDADHPPGNSEHARIYRAVKQWPAVSYLVRTRVPAVNLADTVRRIARS
ncbi:MAG TPA: hypothetical protein VGM67_13385 [Gemmatimonadaceae bacterium]